MRLEVGSFHIKRIGFGARTAVDHGTLVVDREEVRRLVLADSHFVDVQVHLVRPGEAVRIINAKDAVEPRWKVSGQGGVFPGFLSAPTTVGEGRTHRLSGVAVLEVAAPVPGEQTHFREQILDMSGPGAEFSPFAHTLNIALEFTPHPSLFPSASVDAKDVLGGTNEAEDYNRATTTACLKVAAYLAKVTAEQTPDEVETFELTPCPPELPLVACLYHTQATWAYGAKVPLPLGTLIHPNELFDGALVGWRQAYRATYWDQNHQAMLELYREHGKSLNFVGCVLFYDITPEREQKERVGSAAAKLARMLGAQGVLVLGINGSNYAIDTMLAVQDCEKLGIKTTLIYLDVGAGPDDPGFVHATPEADAIVCIGSRDRKVTLPPTAKVIGGGRLASSSMDPHGGLTVNQRDIHTSCSNQGLTRQTTRFF
ncbi:MAG: beta-aspartyl-peptidase [Deltaproteobacteria bacterium]|nr:beta-aspartyl-peptidase [Deltaproteobacteria bacterium]